MGGGDELCWALTDEEAARVADALAIWEDLDCSASVAEAEMWLPAEAKLFVEIEAIAVNAKTAVEIEASSGIAMGGAQNS